MAYQVLMSAPAGSGLGGTITGNFPSGFASYTVNAQGVVAVNPADVQAMVALGFIASPLGVTPGPVRNVNANGSPLQLFGADITGGSDVFLKTTGSESGGGQLRLPSVANLIATLPNPQPGQSWRLRVLNDGGGEWTVQPQTGWTLVDTMTILTNTWRDFIVTINSVSSPAATLADVGAGTAP